MFDSHHGHGDMGQGFHFNGPDVYIPLSNLKSQRPFHLIIARNLALVVICKVVSIFVPWSDHI